VIGIFDGTKKALLSARLLYAKLHGSDLLMLYQFARCFISYVI
jgi:hypothetical protein